MKRLHRITLAIVPTLVLTCLALHAAEKPKRQPSPQGAKVYIIEPKDGQTVKKKFTVVFGLKGMGICPAGVLAADGVAYPNTGHHHLMLDQEKLPPMDQVLPVDKPEICLHFGKGQTETTLELPPGKHTLQLIFADYAHVPHDPPVVSEKVTVTVE